ncbi:hypothetical protein [uncultured Jatrophihabitans sp.]|uniref:hypothetical protein n=1 Tax=uncultured Jatrophihabitans sp. TaxID=1610747 RepID=UPI0035CBE072
MGAAGDTRSALRRAGRSALGRIPTPQLHAVGARAANRRLLASAAIVVLATAGLATAALASSSTDGVSAKDAAATVQRKPNYLLPVGTLLANGSLPRPAMAGDRGAVGVPSGTAPAPTTPTAGAGNQAIAVYSGGAGTLTPAGIATLAMQHGCSAAQAVIATAVAMAESGGSPSAQGDVSLMTPVWDWSAGLWQIRGLRAERNTGGLRDSIANQNAAKNAAAMDTISSGCSNWTPWSTYNNGAYQAYLSVAEQAVHYVTGYYRAHGNTYPVVAPPDAQALVPTGGAGAVGPQSVATAAAGKRPSPRTTHLGSVPKPTASSAAGGGQPTSNSSSGGGGTGGGGGGTGGGGTGGGGQPAPATSTKAGVPNPVSSVISKLPLPTSTKKKPTPKPTLPSLPVSTLPGLPGL